VGFVLATTATALGQAPPPSEPILPPASLKTVATPEPVNLIQFVQDRQAAMQLGKALFWDMQVGSDGVTACATCHFHAGTDRRIKNQLSPGLRAGDNNFETGGPNWTLQPSDFPLRQLADPENRHSVVIRDSNDVVSSMGTFPGDFVSTRRGFPVDSGTPGSDSVFQINGVAARRSQSRNTPTVINAVFNAKNFWDGRANHYFNGVTAFGPLDTESTVFINNEGLLAKQFIRIPFASLASQAVAPPLSDTEMSLTGRSFPALGRKLLNLRPLAKQAVHPQDSLLGPLSRARRAGAGVSGNRGLNTTYVAMIKAAFQPVYWNSKDIITFSGNAAVIDGHPGRPLADNEFTQLEANFSLFFGLAVQVYESTLVSDDSPFDQHQDGDFNALTARQKQGMEIFFDRGKCAVCHAGPEFTEAAKDAVELMPTVDEGGKAFYDAGFFNTGSRLSSEDPGIDGTAPLTNPLTGQPFPLSLSKLAVLKKQGLLPLAIDPFVPALPVGVGVPDPNRVVTAGAFKSPTLRNVELTGPYFHNGGMSTLRQVVDFYDRGGDFRDQNIPDVDRFIAELSLTTAEKEALIDFLLALTDERVRWETVPFDHPQLFVPNGLRGDHNSTVGTEQVQRDGFRDNEEILEIPALGAGGRLAAGLPPLEAFMGLDPFQP
jgi:cytochrome c peroxidase